MSTPREDAFKKAYSACHASFVRYCSALAYGRMDVEDLVQDVLLSAWRNFDNIQNKDQFLHYLMRAAKNRTVSFWRKPHLREELVERHSNRLIAEGASPEAVMDVQLLYRMLDRLPPKQQQALVMFEISGFSMKEIAEMQKSTEGAVKTLVSRGREQLRQLMSEKMGPGQVHNVLQTLQTILL